MFPGIWDAGGVMGSAGVLAHQGGWDEALMVIVPVGIFGGLVWVALKRSAPQDDHPSPDGPGAA